MGSLAMLAFCVVGSGGPAALGSPRRTAASAPAGSAGAFSAVAAVPGSSDVWAVGYVGAGAANDSYFVGRLHNGHWQSVKAPRLGGRYGSLDVVTASSATSVWFGGARQPAHSIQELPAVWRWTGTKFVAAKLPPLFAGACRVDSISASSATNVWAVGSISTPADNSFVMLHYNGKAWSTVAFPEDNDLAPSAVSTSSANNAWATDGISLYHWNGILWTLDGAAPANVQLNGVATDSPTLAYAAGFNTTSDQPVIMRFNGKSWSTAVLAKNVPHEVEVSSITLHGSSAWAVGVREEQPYEPVILHSTGGVWSAQNSPGKNYVLEAISAGSATHASAVGYRYVGVGEETFFDYYNGRTW
ncbi:MAG: hypothetical protein ABSE47_18050, partial [Acidimicrobiales bacterium]